MSVPGPGPLAADTDAEGSAHDHGREGRAVRDVVQQVVIRISNLALGIVVIVLLPRALGPAGYGQWATLLTIVSLVELSTELGMTSLTIRRAAVAPARERALLGALVRARALLSAPTIVVVAGIAAGLATTPTMLVAGLVLACGSLFSVPSSLSAVHAVRLRNAIPELLSIVQSLLWTAVVVALYLTDGTALVLLAVGMVSAIGVAAFLQAWLAIRIVRPDLADGRPLTGELLRAGTVLGAATLIMLSYQRIDLVLAFRLADERSAGLYAAAIQTFERLAVLPAAITATATPLLAAAWSQGAASLGARHADILRAMVGLTLPAAVLGGVLAEPITRLLYGPGFAGTATLVPIAAATFAVSTVEYTITTLYLVLERQRLLLRMALVVLVLNVTANLLLLPVYGIVASAWIALGTQVLVVTIGVVVLRDVLSARTVLVGALLPRVVLANVVLGVVVFLAHRAGAPLAVVLALAAVVYPAAVLALRGVTPDELRAIRAGRAT